MITKLNAAAPSVVPSRAAQYRTAAAFAVLGLLLSYLVLKHTLGAYLVWTTPSEAVGTWLSTPRTVIAHAREQLNSDRLQRDSQSRPHSVAAFSRVAQKFFDPATIADQRSKTAEEESKSPVDTKPMSPEVPASTLAAEVTQALLSEPLSASGFRTLALLSDLDGDTERTRRLMEAAGVISRHDPVAHYWLMAADYDAQAFSRALYHADVLMRSNTALMSLTLPVLGQLAEEPSVQNELVKALERNPPWRAALFSSITRYTRDIRTPLVLMQAMNRTGNPPSATERYLYMRFLIANEQHELAYYTWLQFMTSNELQKVALLRNGDFEDPVSENPFDWQIPRSGATVARASCPGAPKAQCLYADFGPSRLSGNLVTQFVVLPPGRFKLTGKYRGEIKARRGLVWQISCNTGTTAKIGETSQILVRTFQWRSFEMAFEVPPTDCPTQVVSLALAARSPSEQIASGTMLFDDLVLTRGTSSLAEEPGASGIR